MGAVLFPVEFAEAQPPLRNVLWICADDLGAFACGAYGSRAAATPSIDGFMAGACRFEHAYCNSPVCTVSRQSFLTGRYPLATGVRVLSAALADRELTLAEILAEAGYETAALGKMHFNSQRTHGFARLSDLAEHRRWLAERRPTPLPEGLEVLGVWRPFRDPAAAWLNARCLPYPAYERDMAATWLADEAAAFLAAQRYRPFFLMVSFHEPHSPFHFPVELAGRRSGDAFPAPPVDPADVPQIPAVFAQLSQAEKQGIAAAYHTSVEFLDRQVGRLLEALEAAGHADDTLVVFFSDHGYMLGQHGRFEKHCSFDPAIRVPLAIRAPGITRPGSVVPALVELVDLVPTTLEIVGCRIPSTVQGRSLGRLLKGQVDAHRQQVVIEYAENEEALIRDPRWKLVYCSGKRERQDGYSTGLPLPGRTTRLYDLESDPQERQDLADHPDQLERRQAMLTALADHFRRLARWQVVPTDATPEDVLDLLLRPQVSEAGGG